MARYLTIKVVLQVELAIFDKHYSPGKDESKIHKQNKQIKKQNNTHEPTHTHTHIKVTYAHLKIEKIYLVRTF